MSDGTEISWTDATWNPVVGCSRVSAGCEHCYAERFAHRFSGPGGRYEGLTVLGKKGPRWTGKVRLVPEQLDRPLRWKRPRRIFVNSMSDLFHEELTNEDIAAVFGVMAAAPQHVFQVLTKRPERMVRWFEAQASRVGIDHWAARCVGMAAYRITGGRTKDFLSWVDRLWEYRTREETRRLWPLPNVWLGVSVEDQKTADERIPLLLETPAAVRWVSYEPALGPVDFTRLTLLRPVGLAPGAWLNALTGHVRGPDDLWPAHLDWIVVGGESGPGARPFDVSWARSVVQQCKAANVPAFIKQLGASPMWSPDERGDWWKGPHVTSQGAPRFRDRKGADPAEWPEDLRVREFPR